jgi:hypothetical protein
MKIYVHLCICANISVEQISRSGTAISVCSLSIVLSWLLKAELTYITTYNIRQCLANAFQMYNKNSIFQAWWYIPVIPALQEAEAGESWVQGLFYTVSSRPAWNKDPVSKQISELGVVACTSLASSVGLCPCWPGINKRPHLKNNQNEKGWQSGSVLASA